MLRAEVRICLLTDKEGVWSLQPSKQVFLPTSSVLCCVGITGIVPQIRSFLPHFWEQYKIVLSDPLEGLRELWAKVMLALLTLLNTWSKIPHSGEQRLAKFRMVAVAITTSVLKWLVNRNLHQLTMGSYCEQEIKLCCFRPLGLGLLVTAAYPGLSRPR